MSTTVLLLTLCAGLSAPEPVSGQAGPPKIATTPAERKIDSRLLLAFLHARKDPRVASLTDFRFVTPDADGRIAVDVLVATPEQVTPVLQKLETLGAVIRSKNPAAQPINARIHLEDLEPLAAMPEVRRVREAMRARTHR